MYYVPMVFIHTKQAGGTNAWRLLMPIFRRSDNRSWHLDRRKTVPHDETTEYP